MSSKVLLPLLALAGAGWGWQHKTEAQVRDALAANEYSLVAFVAPSTDASKALEPHWAAVEDAIPTALSVDCPAAPSLCADLDVSSFPAIRLYHQDGTKHHYRGPRKGSEIAAFVRRMLRPAVTTLDKKTMNSFRDSDDVVLIAQMAESETFLRERFAELADRLRDRHAFGLITIPEAPGRIGCYNNADGAYHMTSELDDVEAMEKLVKKCASQLVPRLTRRNEVEYLNAGKSLVYFFSTAEENLDSWTSAVKPLARKYHQYITFVTVDLGEYPDMPALLGLPEDMSQGVAVQNPVLGLSFPFKGDQISVDAVEQLIIDISEGRAEAWEMVERATGEEAAGGAEEQEAQEAQTESKEKQDAEAPREDAKADAKESDEKVEETIKEKAEEDHAEAHDEL